MDIWILRNNEEIDAVLADFPIDAMTEKEGRAAFINALQNNALYIYDINDRG